MGRRVQPGEDRRNPINARIRDSLRARLEEAADLSNRTLSHEIEERLERSFDAQDIIMRTFKTTKNLSIATAIVSAWDVIEIASGKGWSETEENLQMARDATAGVLAMVRSQERIDGNYRQPTGLEMLGDPRLQDRKALADMAAYTAVCWAKGIPPAEKYRDLMYETADRLFVQRAGSDSDEKSKD